MNFDVIFKLYILSIFIVYLGSIVCVTNASVYDKDWNITTPSTRQSDTYTCSFPFMYQGKVYNNKCVPENKYSYFCAINAKPGHGLDCPGCWQNETYKIGYCVYGDQCGLGEY